MVEVDCVYNCGAPRMRRSEVYADFVELYGSSVVT